MTFDILNPGDRIFIDANIFVYFFLGKSMECRRFFERCHSGDVAGFTTTSVVAETMHRLMTTEAVTRKFISSRLVVKKLREHPDIVRQLLSPNLLPDQIAAMNVKIVPLTETMLRKSAAIRSQYGLLTNDSLVVSAMQELTIDNLGTNDDDFGRVAKISIFGPRDISMMPTP